MDNLQAASQIYDYLRRKGHDVTDQEFERIIKILEGVQEGPQEAPELLNDPDMVHYSESNFEAVRKEICGFKRNGPNRNWRKESTPWNHKEKVALRKVFPFSRSDFRLLKKYYNAPIPKKEDFRRKDIQTFLNNWNGEIDRAVQFDEQTEQKIQELAIDYSQI